MLRLVVCMPWKLCQCSYNSINIREKVAGSRVSFRVFYSSHGRDISDHRLQNKLRIVQITQNVFYSYLFIVLLFLDFTMTSLLTYTFKSLPSTSKWALRFCKLYLFFLFQISFGYVSVLHRHGIVLLFVSTLFCLPALRPLSSSSQLQAAAGIVICKRNIFYLNVKFWNLDLWILNKHQN